MAQPDIMNLAQISALYRLSVAGRFHISSPVPAWILYVFPGTWEDIVHSLTTSWTNLKTLHRNRDSEETLCKDQVMDFGFRGGTGSSFGSHYFSGEPSVSWLEPQTQGVLKRNWHTTASFL